MMGQIKQTEITVEPSKPKIRVVDVPATATALEAETLLNEFINDGYYLRTLSVLPACLPQGIGTRAFFDESQAEQKAAKVEARNEADSAARLELARIVKAEPRISGNQLAARLRLQGHTRSGVWITAERLAIKP
jgi:hypothetical protein